MRLLKIYSNQASFKTVEFNRNGLSYIVARQKNPGLSEKGKTYNGVGKSLLVRIIHFCLGSSVKNYTTFCKNLPGWEFYLDYMINGSRYTSKRTTEKPQRITLNNREMSIKTFNSEMESVCFDIPDDVSYLSFRSLIPFFIRPERESYVNYDKPVKSWRDYQTQLYNALVLGLDVFLAQKKQVIKKEQDRIKKLESNFRNDSLLRDFFTGNRDIVLTLVDLEERIRKFEDDLGNFKVAEDYYDVQLEADKVERDLFTLNNEIILLQSNIENIGKSLALKPDMDKERIKEIYTESNINFPERLVRTLDELEDFYEALISNRKRRLMEQQSKLKIEQQEKKQEVKELQKNFDDMMQYLGEHQALDVFVTINQKNAALKAERDHLVKYRELQSEYKKAERKIEKDIIEYTEVTEKYLTEIKPETVVLRDFFRGLAKRFYPESVAGLTIDNNDGQNQQRYIIDAKIESDSSDGINNVKIFCYDLTVLFRGHNHHIDFIFHDSRLFDGTDERQKTEMFNTVDEMFADSDKQYIATVNQNQLGEIKKHMSAEKFERIIVRNTKLTLTDESDSEKLLGIKVDLREK